MSNYALDSAVQRLVEETTLLVKTVRKVLEGKYGVR